MTAAVAENLAQIPMSSYLTATLERAASYAEAQSHQEVTLEHVLLALAEDPEASVILKSSDVDIARLQTDVSNFLGNISVRRDAGGEPQPVHMSQELQHILEAAAEAARQGQRQEINGAILLAAIVGDGTSSAAHILRAQGLTFDATISALRNSVQPAAQPNASDAPGPIDDAHQGVVTGQQDGAGAPAKPQPPQPGPPTPAAPPPLADPLGEARRKVDERLGADTQPAAPSLSQLSVEPKWEPAAAPQPHPNLEPASKPAPPPPARKEPGPELASQPASGQPGQEQWAPVQPPARQDRPTTPRLQRVPPPLPPDAGLRPPRSESGSARGDAKSFAPPAEAEPTWSQNPAAAPPRPSAPPSPETARTGAAAPVPPWIGDAAVRQPSGPGAGSPTGLQRPAATPLQPRSTQIKVETGQLVENIPRRMKAGVSELVEVRIARANVKALAQGLQGGGTAVRHDALITKAMSVKLRAPDGGFWVEAASPETQWIDNVLGVMTDDFASWRWSVTPKAAGQKKLQLVVSARTVGSDGLAAETALPDQLYTVKVGVNYKRSAKRLTGWLLAAVFGGVLARFGEDAFQAIKTFLANGGLG